MLGFGLLGYGLSSKTADSESTSVNSFTPCVPPQAGDIIGWLPGSSSKTWTCFDLSSRAHSHAHIQNTQTNVSHAKQCTSHHMHTHTHTEEANSLSESPSHSNHILQLLTLQNAMISYGYHSMWTNRHKSFSYPQ